MIDKIPRNEVWRLRAIAVDLKNDDDYSAEQIEAVLQAKARQLGIDPAIASKIAADFGTRLPKLKQGVRASDVRTTQVEWLWRYQIPKAKLTIIDGDPGKGKSLVTMNLAACVSQGMDFPGGSVCPKGNVVIANLDDAANDTIVPRLIAAGGDPRRVILLPTIFGPLTHKGKRDEEPLCLPDHIPLIEELIRTQSVILVVIDPLLSCLSQGTDSYRAQAIAKVLIQLKNVAESTGAAIVIVRHLTKTSENTPAIYRGTGSIAIAGTARQSFMVLEHPDNPELRILARVKYNLTKPVPSWIYRIEENSEGMPFIRWIEGTSMTADDILAKQQNSVGPESVKREYAEVLAAILTCKEKLKHGNLSEKLILEAFNAGRQENEKFTPQKLGQILKRLKISTEAHTENGSAAIVWDSKLIDELCVKYAVTHASP